MTAQKKPKKKRKTIEERTVFKSKQFTIVAGAFGYTLLLDGRKNRPYYYSGALELFRGLLRHCRRSEIAASGLSDINSYILVTERANQTAISTIKNILAIKGA